MASVCPSVGAMTVTKPTLCVNVSIIGHGSGLPCIHGVIVKVSCFCVVTIYGLDNVMLFMYTPCKIFSHSCFGKKIKFHSGT